MTQMKINEILENHARWVNGEEGGIRADLSGANLRYADLSGANLSGAKLLSPSDFLKKNFEQTSEGYVVYKTFGSTYSIPDGWEIADNSILTEAVNPNRTELCGCGINVAPLAWVRKNDPSNDIYQLLIRWEWLPGVVVPYNTDGKIRCEKAMILGKVEGAIG